MEERDGFGSQADRVLQNGPGQMHLGVAQPQRGRGLPPRPLKRQCSRGNLHRHRRPKHRTIQPHGATASQRPQLRRRFKLGPTEPGVAGDRHCVELSVVGESDLLEPGIAGEGSRAEFGRASEGRFVEVGIAGESDALEPCSAGEGRPFEPRGADADLIRGIVVQGTE